MVIHFTNLCLIFLQINKWCSTIDVLQYYGSQEQRADLRAEIFQSPQDYDIILTTYSMCYSQDDRKLFKRITFEYAIFDEAHQLKNMNSKKYNGLIMIKVN